MALALAANEENRADNERLDRAIRLALDHWNAARYRSDNWWWNQIGAPRLMRDIVALMGDELSGKRRVGAIEVVGQHKLGGGGANLLWSAELSLHHGCFTGDRTQIAHAAQRLWAEITRGRGEGIQDDWSYHQHGKRLQTFHYGKSYLDVVCKISWQLRQTPWSIPEEKRRLISNYILEGVQWMCRGSDTVPGTLDRAVSRQGSLGGADVRFLLRIWREVDPGNRERIDAFLARQAGEGVPLAGYRHFPQSDFTAYHHPEASVFLKTISSRTGFTESINSENKKGVPYLHCGDHYVLRDGLEYAGLQPVWQWHHLPGLTTAKEGLQQRRETFVGGVGNGSSGLTAMDYTRTGHDEALLSLRKTWFFHDDLVICLMGGIERTRLDGPVVSSLEQCRLRGKVMIKNREGEVIEAERGRHSYSDAQWLLHNEIGYIPLGASELMVFLGERDGSWHVINGKYDKDKVQAPVFQILLGHGKASTVAGWTVVLGATAEKLDEIVNKPAWAIMRNDRDCQSISLHNGQQMAAFFTAGSTGRAGEEITVDEPCLAMWSEGRIWMSDPSMEGRAVRVRSKAGQRSFTLPKGGKTETMLLETPTR